MLRALALRVMPLLVLVPLVVHVGTAPADAATPSTVTPSTTSVNEAPDWASDAIADPVDLSNDEDLSPIDRHGVSNLTLSDGVARFTTTGGGYVEPMYQLGIPPHGRDSSTSPLDGQTYTRVALRMWSGASTNLAGGLFWFDCWEKVPSCASARSFQLRPGWHTYDIDMTQAPDLIRNIAWDDVTGFRIMPTGSGGPVDVAIDWVRFYQPAGEVSLDVTGGNGVEVWWDSDADPTNNGTATAPGRTAGRLATGVGNGGRVTFPASSVPPGTYRFYTREGSQVGPYSTPVVVQPRPRPLVLSPSLSGGDDWATTVRGDAWDMSQPSDIGAVANFVPSFADGVLTGRGAGPAPWDPSFELATPTPIDAATYHRLTFRAFYDGGFSLADEPGGGMVMRLIWGTDNGFGGQNWHNGQDIVVLPGWQTISVDLTTSPLAAIQDEADPNPVGWGGPASGWISRVRFDPHEDPGGRTWKVDDVRLTRNDRTENGFTFTFTDGAHQPGTTAEIGLDTDRRGFDGTTVVQGVTTVAGTNAVRWDGRGVASGTYWPYVTLRSATGAVSRTYASGPLDVTAPRVDPFGALDSATGAPSGIRVQGWTIDPDTGQDQAIGVHVYVDGRFAGLTGATDVPRPDVAAAFPGYGSRRGYDLTVPASPGAHQVCTYGINVGPGTNTLLGCRNVVVPGGSPFGNVDWARSAGPGRITLAGWALDPDTYASIDVHVYVNGAFAGAVTPADRQRGDVHQAFGYGDRKGFELTVAGRSDVNTVCAYGINVGSGTNALLACRTVDLGASPFGALDVVQRNGTTVTVAGWAIDPDTAAPIAVHVYRGGSGAAIVTAAGPRPDVGAAFPGYGAEHGYTASFVVPPGPHRICIYAINAPGTPGTNPVLSCRDV